MMGQERECRVCHCTDLTPCTEADGRPCGWAEIDLCTKCEAKAARPAKIIRPNVVSDAAALIGEMAVMLQGSAKESSYGADLANRVRGWQAEYRETIDQADKVARGAEYDAWLNKRDGEPTVTFQGGDPLGGPCTRIYAALLSGQPVRADSEINTLFGYASNIETLDMNDLKIVSLNRAASGLDDYYASRNSPPPAQPSRPPEGDYMAGVSDQPAPALEDGEA